MKGFIYCLLLLTNAINLHAQIYNKQQHFKYEVCHIIEKDTINKFAVNLHCKGKEWLSPKNNLPIPDSWLIEWSYTDPESNKTHTEITGVKETTDRIFLHPIRLERFKCLEFCPFPMVYKPVFKGKTWEWVLKNINRIYYPPNTKEIEHVINKYSVKDKSIWYDKVNKQYLNCYTIEATGSSPLGKTKLIAEYSDAHGFVRMEFYTINKDCYIFELIINKKSFNFLNY